MIPVLQRGRLEDNGTGLNGAKISRVIAGFDPGPNRDFTRRPALS